MRKSINIFLSLIFALALTSFGVHKFYMAIYQVNYAPEKKMLQITSRIFIEDLNFSLEKKYQKKFFIGTEKETAESVDLFKKYMSDKFVIKVNGQFKTLNFLSKEVDGDVLICYYNCKEISKIKSIEIVNSLLVECFPEQQNIIHISAFGKKNSFLFNDKTTKQVLNY
jgi:hypothetical protein